MNELDECHEQSKELAEKLSQRASLEDEINKLKRILENKLDELDRARLKNEKLENDLISANEEIAKGNDFKAKADMLEQDIIKLSNNFKKVSKENDEIKNRNRQLEISMEDSQNLRNELSNIKRMLEAKMNEVDHLKDKITDLEMLKGQEGIAEIRTREYEGNKGGN